MRLSAAALMIMRDKYEWVINECVDRLLHLEDDQYTTIDSMEVAYILAEYYSFEGMARFKKILEYETKRWRNK